jgi:hypothetical protein
MPTSQTLVMLPCELSPADKAALEICSLSSRRDLQPIIRIGGKLRPDEMAENEGRRAAYQKERLGIIAKYRVADIYLAPLKQEEERLDRQLAQVRADIAAIEEIRSKAV